MMRSPLDQSGERIGKPARRSSDGQVRHPEGINRTRYDAGSAPSGPQAQGLHRAVAAGSGSLNDFGVRFIRERPRHLPCAGID